MIIIASIVCFAFFGVLTKIARDNGNTKLWYMGVFFGYLALLLSVIAIAS